MITMLEAVSAITTGVVRRASFPFFKYLRALAGAFVAVLPDSTHLVKWLSVLGTGRTDLVISCLAHIVFALSISKASNLRSDIKITDISWSLLHIFTGVYNLSALNLLVSEVLGR